MGVAFDRAQDVVGRVSSRGDASTWWWTDR